MKDAPESSLDHAASVLLGEPESVEEQVVPEAETETAELEEESSVESEVESDEVEETESEPEEEAEESEEPEEEEQSEESFEQYYSVKVDGEELEVNLEELLGGYQRQKDYTKKTQTLSQQRKDFESKQAEMEQLQQTYVAQASMANEVLNRELQQFEKLDWETLKTADPVGYVQKQLEIQDVRNRQQQLVQEAQAIRQQQLQTQQTELQKVVEAEKEIVLDAFPEWKNQDNAKANQQQIVDYARSHGFEDSELANVYRARDLLILDKARKYDELQDAKKGITKKKSPPKIRKVVKSKAPAPKGTAKKKQVQGAREKLRKSGSLKDAAALMYQMQDGKEVHKPKR